SDHYGRRKFLLAGGAFFALASFAAAESRTLNELLLARALTGLAAGTLSTCSITYAADWFEYSVRGRAIGLISSAYFAAPILGVPLAAQIADRYGWRRAFLFFAGLAVATALATLSLPRERPTGSEVQSPKSEVQNPSSGVRPEASDLGPRTSDSK